MAYDFAVVVVVVVADANGAPFLAIVVSILSLFDSIRPYSSEAQVSKYVVVADLDVVWLSKESIYDVAGEAVQSFRPKIFY